MHNKKHPFRSALWHTFYKLNSNSSFVPAKPTSGNITIGIWGVNVHKVGRIVNILFNVQGSIAVANTAIPLFTLPAAYRPLTYVAHNYIAQGGGKMLLVIDNTTGECDLHAIDAVPTGGSSFILRQCITYVSAI